MKTIIALMILMVFAVLLFGCETVDRGRPPHQRTTTTTTTEETTIRRPNFGANDRTGDRLPRYETNLELPGNKRPYYRTSREQTFAVQPVTEVVTATTRSY